MLNFTLGPVQCQKEILEIGAEQVPYFRTQEFSNMMLENERLIKKFSYADDNSRVVFLTASGTAAMEATIINFFTVKDKLIVINGGGFGQRFVDLCEIHNIEYAEIKLKFGENITLELLEKYKNQGHTGLLVNIHETSTGVLYDMSVISNFCKEEDLFLVADAISSFIADDIDMEALGIDVLIMGSQKALAVPPGISILVLSSKAIDIVSSGKVQSLYFDLKLALINAERGQTPFTPAVSLLIQINKRLNIIDKYGIKTEREKIAEIAKDFRNSIHGLRLEIASSSLSNALTPLHPVNTSATKVFEILKGQYGIWVCPNGGVLSDKLFRVGHIGALTIEDNKKLLNAMYDMAERKLL